MGYTVKIDNTKMYDLLNFDADIFTMTSQLILKTDDLTSVKNDFRKINKLEIYNGEAILASCSSFDTFSDIIFIQNQYDEITRMVVDVLQVTLTKANLAEQVQRLDEKINPVTDIDKMSLDEYKNFLQEKNKSALAEFLSEQSVEFNGKPYGVAEDDQNEMALNLMQYQLLTQAGQSVVLEWHSKKSKCETFTSEEFLQLTAIIKAFVYPYMQQMQAIKEQIFKSTSKDELSKIKIEYTLLPPSTGDSSASDNKNGNEEESDTKTNEKESNTVEE